MKKSLILSLALIPLLILMGLNLRSNFDVITSSTKQSTVQAQYASLPLAFEPNQGQVDDSTRFLVHHGQATTYFDGENTTTTIGDSQITMSLDGASTPIFNGTDQLESKTNYFIGNDQSKWYSNIPNYKNLLAKNVYPGIDLKYYGTNSQLEHDFIVSPGTDYKQIAFHFIGQKNLEIDKNGNLIMKTIDTDIKLSSPITYQQTSNSKRTIPSHFKLIDTTITIALETEYDHSLPLIIDPSLAYSTYLGGSSTDYGFGIQVDSTGNTYIGGFTDSTDFPIMSPYNGSNSGGLDAFVSKFNPSGSALIYSTYYGGTGNDQINGLAIDASGNIYFAGLTTSTDLPTASAYQSSNAGGQDAFVAMLDPTGSTLNYSTYLGGTGSDQVGLSGITVDSGSGNAYIVGQTDSSDFPMAGTPFQGAYSGGSNDAFVAQLDSSSTLNFSTYLGGSGNDIGSNIGIDSIGNIYVSGETDSSDFPTASAFQGSNAGGWDAFATQFDSTASSLTYSTYLGGTGDDKARSMAVDLSGNTYIAGITNSSDFPTVSPLQASNAGGFDNFITKFDSTGATPIYSTYLGGSGGDFNRGTAIDSGGSVYLTGDTSSINFPTVSSIQPGLSGGTDAYVAKINSSGTVIVYSTYLGGSGSNEASEDIAVDTSGNAYITGGSDTTDFPTALPFQANNAGIMDIFVAKILDQPLIVTGVADPALAFTLSSTICDLGVFSTTQTKSCTHTITAATNAANGYVISYIPTTTLTSGANSISAMASQTSSVVASEQFGLNLKANTAVGSFTAADFGADPSGGSGVVMTGYETANQFKFATGGEDIAQSTVASEPTTYTTSFIANIEFATEAGTYSTPVTYNIVPSY